MPNIQGRTAYNFGFMAVWLVVVLGASGCQGTQTFSNMARAGDTVSVAAGLDTLASRDAVNITVRDAAGNVTTYLPGDSSIRAVMNLYPDPQSYFVIGAATGQDFRSDESVYGSYADAWLSMQEKRDWRQTIAFIDLPSSMAEGLARVSVETSAGQVTTSSLQILPGVGAPNPMDIVGGVGAPDDRLKSLEHMKGTRVTVAGSFSVKPAAVEYRFSHDPDSAQGGVGVAHVTHARGDLAGVTWHDNGTHLSILVTSNVPPEKFHRNIFSVAVTGGITGLRAEGMTVVDAEGNVLPGIQMVLSPSLGVISPPVPLVNGATYTVLGSSLCRICDGEENGGGFWLRAPNGWMQPAVLNMTTDMVTFTVPPGVEAGAGFIWVGHSGGSDVMPVQFQ